MNSELARRIAFTLGALLIYRLGIHIPVPGIDLTAWMRIFDSQAGGLLGQLNVLSGGAVRSLGVFTMSITPYITAATFLQLISLVSRRLAALWKEGEAGPRRFDQCARYGAALLTAMQAYGIAIGLEGTGGVVSEPGALFRLTTVVTLTGGTLSLIWLSGQITDRGIGNGIALILFAGVTTTLPGAVAGTLELNRQGVISSGVIAISELLTFAVVALIVAVERARRRLPVRFAERQTSAGTLPSQTTDLVLKLNPAGVMPVVMASWVLSIVFAPLMLAALYQGRRLPAGMIDVLGMPLHQLVYAALIALFVFVYTAFVSDPEQMAHRLTTHGGVIPNIAPGDATAEHLDGLLTRVAAIGAVYLAFLMLLPELLITFLQVPFYLGGIPVLTLVCTTLDIEAQVRGLLETPAR